VSFFWVSIYILIVLLIDIIAVRIWLAVLRKFDPYAADKNSSRQLTLFFRIGILTVPAALLLYGVWEPLERLLLTRSYVINEFVGEFIVTGPVEELAKFGVFFLFAIRNDSVKEPQDGVLQAASVGVAFAGIENFNYALSYGIGVLLLRSVISFAGHMSYAALWGFSAGIYLYSRKKGKGQTGFLPIIYTLLISAALHGLFNFSLSMNSLVLAFTVELITIGLACAGLSYLRNISPYVLIARIPFRRWREGVRQMKEELKVNPQSNLFHHRLASYHLCGGELDEAESHFRTAARLKKDDYLSRIFINVIRYMRGDRDQAVSNLRSFREKLGKARFQKARLAVNRVLSRRSIGQEISDLLYNISIGRDISLGRWRPASSDPRRYTVSYRRYRNT
jgi:RsiW-degrading membrane proteinase PrsW (M82 family)